MDLANLLVKQELEWKILEIIRSNAFDVEAAKILEIGCGGGHWLRRFILWGARPQNLVGLDLMADSIQLAERLTAPSAQFRVGNAASLDFPRDTFDIVCQFTVFSSVFDPEMRKRMASEMLRVLKPEGLVIWYDLFVGNPSNPNVRGIKKREIRELFPDTDITISRVTIALPLLRTLGEVAPPLYGLLCAPKLLCTHYLGVLRKLPFSKR